MTTTKTTTKKNSTKTKICRAKPLILHSAGQICRLFTFPCVHRYLDDTKGMGMQTEQRLRGRGAEQKLAFCSTFMLSITCNMPHLSLLIIRLWRYFDFRCVYLSQQYKDGHAGSEQKSIQPSVWCPADQVMVQGESNKCVVVLVQDPGSPASYNLCLRNLQSHQRDLYIVSSSSSQAVSSLSHALNQSCQHKPAVLIQTGDSVELFL